MNIREKIYGEIDSERAYQDGRWGTTEDDGHTINDWVAFIVMYAGKAVFFKNTKEEQRIFLLKVAALAVAALEAFDRNGGFVPRHYDRWMLGDSRLGIDTKIAGDNEPPTPKGDE